jgi:hypothetical protein
VNTHLSPLRAITSASKGSDQRPPARPREGKVVESWDNFYQLGMMQQLGVIPSPEQAQA